MSLLVKDVLLDGRKTSVYVEDNAITEIGVVCDADQTIDGRGKAIIPGFVNTHTHAAMTLFRGYADDMEFWQAWPKRIWPAEAKLTREDVYWGSKLACLEMVKSGTTCFNDMYFFPEETAKATKETGLRAVLCRLFLDEVDKQTNVSEKDVEKTLKAVKKEGGRLVAPAVGPHAIYSVGKDGLQWIKEYSDKHDLLIHLHLAETRKENEDCVKAHGMRPIPYLEKIGLLCDRLIACHSVWLSKAETKTLAKYDVKVSHNPISGMKLADGGVMPYPEMLEAGVTVSLGTDGCASNNNLSMIESMKVAALLQKQARWDPTVMPASEAFTMATSAGAKALRINCGFIREGMLADFVLIDLSNPRLVPGHNLIADLVYSADSSCVHTVVCDGKVLMENHLVPGEKEIIKSARKAALDLIKRTEN